jgi:RimJ/RimL family protein N-acetyltransferase
MRLETARLLLRPQRLADAPELFQFLGDAATMQYTTRRTSVRDCRRYLAAHERQRRRIGYAPWVIVEKSSGAVIGVGGLYVDPFDPVWGIEVGYFFARHAWGRGFATELTRLCIDVARQQRSWSMVRGFVHPKNLASRRVLLKAGFQEERYLPEIERILYRYDLPEVKLAGDGETP